MKSHVGLWGGLVLAAVIAIVGVRLATSRSEAGLDGPVIDLSQLPPAVAGLLEDAEEETRRSPHSAGAWGYRAMVLMAHDFLPEALVCLKHAERLDSADFRWPYYHGMCLVFTDSAGAIDCFERAVSLNESLPLLRFELAERLLTADRLDEAEAQLRHARTMAPDEPRGDLAWGRLAFLRNELQESLVATERAVAAAPDARAARELLSQILYRLNRKEEAQEQARLCQELGTQKTVWYDPVMAEVVSLCRAPSHLFAHAVELCGQSHFVEAETLLKRALALEPKQPEYHVLLGFVFIQQRNWPAADETLRRAIELAPHNAEAHYYRGVLLSLQSKWAPAARSFRAAIERKPDYAAAHYSLGNCLNELGDVEGSVAAFRVSLHSQPNLVAAHTRLAEVLLSAGCPDEAIVHLTTAVELSPSDAHLRERLAKALEDE